MLEGRVADLERRVGDLVGRLTQLTAQVADLTGLVYQHEGVLRPTEVATPSRAVTSDSGGKLYHQPRPRKAKR